MEKVLNEILGKLDSLEQGHRQLRQELKTDIKTINGELESLNRRIGNLEENQVRLESKVDKLELRIENEVIGKIRALLNGYTLRGDQIEKLQKHLDERLDSIETDTRYLVARVAMLEKLANENSR
ncbi:MAG: hypothetical protein QHH75_04825 [Bacillota bacterium]|nr:hypothetical protein [Bacillota bacterium]